MSNLSSTFRRFRRQFIGHSYLLQGTSFVFLTGWIYFFGAKSFAVAAVVLSQTTMVFAILDAGLTAAIAGNRKLDENSWRSLLAQQLGIGLLVMLLVGAWLFLQPQLFYEASRLQRGLMWLFVLGSPLFAIARARQQLLSYDLQANWLMGVRWIGLVSRYGIALFIYWYWNDLSALAIGVICSIVIENLFALIVGTTSYSLQVKWPAIADFKMVQVRWLGAVDHFMAELRNNIDVLLFAVAISPEALGQYSYVKRLFMQLRGLLLGPWSSVLLQGLRRIRSTKQQQKIYLEQISLVSRYLVPLFLLVTAFLLLASELLLQVQLNRSVVVLLGVAYAASCLPYLSGSMLYAIARTDVLVKFNIATTVVLILLYLLIFYWPLEFVLQAFAVFFLLMSLVHAYWLVVKPLSVEYGKYFHVAGSAIGICTVFYSLQVPILEGGASLLIAVVVLLLFIGLQLWQDRHLVKRKTLGLKRLVESKGLS